MHTNAHVHEMPYCKQQQPGHSGFSLEISPPCCFPFSPPYTNNNGASLYHMWTPISKCGHFILHFYSKRLHVQDTFEAENHSYFKGKCDCASIKLYFVFLVWKVFFFASFFSCFYFLSHVPVQELTPMGSSGFWVVRFFWRVAEKSDRILEKFMCVL